MMTRTFTKAKDGKEESTAEQIRALNKKINRGIEHFTNMPLSAKIKKAIGTQHYSTGISPTRGSDGVP